MDNVVKLYPLKTFSDDIIKTARDIFSESSSEQHWPTMITEGITEEGEPLVFITILADLSDREKGGRDRSIMCARALNMMYRAKRYALITENWMLQQTPDKIEEVKKYVGHLEEHPDKIECLSILVVDKKKALMTTFEIGPDRKLKDENLSEGMSVSGEFCTFLPPNPEGISKEDREYLREGLKKYFNLQEIIK